MQAGQDAISSQNTELAKLLAEKAAVYAPESEALANLNHRLRGGLPVATRGALSVAGFVISPGHVRRRAGGFLR